MAKAQYDCGWYLVAFLDVQGQREKFRNLKVPNNDAEREALNTVVLGTAGFVDRLRDQLRAELQDFEAEVSKSWGLTESLLPRFAAFSDSLVMSIGLWNVGHLATIGRIHSILKASCNAMLKCFSEGHALRGGIEMGFSTELESGEVYGNALLDAYVLESKRAQYPRVLIGKELWKFLSIGVSECETMKGTELAKICDVIKKTVAYTCIDSDGEKIVDFLGQFARKYAAPSTAADAIQPAYEFVLAEQKRFATDAKLGPRYALLRQYFESRLSLWGIPIIPS
jgi:hypothetical protein